VIKASELAESSPTRGSMIIKPWGMKVWDLLKKDLDGRITEKHGVDNAYFPLLIPKSFLSKEAEHVDGFAKECAVVTHHRLKVGRAKRAQTRREPLPATFSFSCASAKKKCCPTFSFSCARKEEMLPNDLLL
jgi:prolyl-tRNA synthetase